MRFVDYISFSIKYFNGKKLRFFMSMFCIFIGIISVIIISVIGESGKKAINKEMDCLGLSGICIKTKTGDFSYLDSRKIKNCLGKKYKVSTFSNFYSKIEYKDKVSEAVVCSGEEDISNILNMKLLYGHLIRKNDIDNLKKVAVISKNVSNRIFDSENSVGKTMKLYGTEGKTNITIVGIIDNSKIYDKIGNNLPSIVYIPSSLFKHLFGETSIGEISLISEGETDLNSIGDVAVSILKNNKSNREIYYEDMNKYKKSISDIADIITLIIMLIGIVSLIVGGISVINTMLISVGERKKEIGIKKAIGASNFEIMSEFLIQSLIIMLFSCILGISIGIGVSYFILNNYGLDFFINRSFIIKALLISAFCGILFGVYPAYCASKIEPCDTLKS